MWRENHQMWEESHHVRREKSTNVQRKSPNSAPVMQSQRRSQLLWSPLPLLREELNRQITEMPVPFVLRPNGIDDSLELHFTEKRNQCSKWAEFVTICSTSRRTNKKSGLHRISILTVSVWWMPNGKKSPLKAKRAKVNVTRICQPFNRTPCLLQFVCTWPVPAISRAVCETTMVDMTNFWANFITFAVATLCSR